MTKVLTVFVLTAIAFGADTAREQKLQQAINLMESKGDAAKAMPMLEDVAHSSDRALAARALLYLGQAQERQGADKARATYERIVKEFGNQTEMVAAAQQRLIALGGSRSSGTFAKRLLCSDCGDDEADFSSDGRWMAFTHWDSGDVAIRDMSTGQVKRLMAKTGTWKDSDAFVETPVLSPDLRQIAYCWDTGEKEDHVQLRVIPNELNGKARVPVDSRENTWYEPTAWSPDGRSVVVIITKKDHTDQIARVAISDGSVRVLKSMDWRFATVWSHPDYSPDGQYIVYSARAVNPSKTPPAPTDPKDEHIYVMAADGSSETEIVKTAGINTSPVWTPDGKHILFTSDRSGRMDLWSVAMQNGKAIGSPSLVSTEIGKAFPMRVHGGSYYYTQRQTGAEYVNIVDYAPNGATQGRLARATESFVGIRPMWSPDGKSIAFKRHHPGNTNEYDLVVHSLETGDERTYLTSLGTTGNGAARWFHDGKSIMTGIRRGDGSGAFYRIDLKIGEFKELGDFPTYALSPDDKTAYVIRRDPKDPNSVPDRISAVDLSTRQEKPIFSLPAPGASSLLLSPDGRALVLKWPDQKSKTVRFARVNVDGTGYREIFNMARQDDGGPMALTKDGRWNYFRGIARR
ncbi:MAG: hypothetical protein LAO55_27995 [Acidobacteriia bacterium]|nr:hypothetical protein [Terriglobia bacterium]